eukprot:scaffold21_cov136-Skeletonema_marinoi.AAC.3
MMNLKLTLTSYYYYCFASNFLTIMIDTHSTSLSSHDVNHHHYIIIIIINTLHCTSSRKEKKQGGGGLGGKGTWNDLDDGSLDD